MGTSETYLHMGLNVLLLRHSGLNGDFGDTSVCGIRGERLRLSGSNGDFGGTSTDGPRAKVEYTKAKAGYFTVTVL